jgi:hypothetical protein
MNMIKTVCVTAVAAGSLALLATQPAIGRDRSPTARSLSDVQSIRVESNLCPSRISEQLTDHGFHSSHSGDRTDAVLKAHVATNGNPSDEDSMEEGRYTTTLVGANDEVLFRQAGYKEGRDLARLCKDIGEEIAEELDDEVS